MTGRVDVGTRALFFALGLFACAAGADQPTSPGDVELAAELHQQTQALLDAIAPGDAAVWNRLLDGDAIQVDENDVVRRKPQILAELKPLPPGLVGHLKIDAFAMVHHGDVAVVTHEDDEYLDYHGQVIRSRFRMTDTWVRGPDGWRVLASQVLAVLEDPPALHLSAGVLCQYAARYRMSPDIVGSYRCGRDELIFEQAGRPDRHFRGEAVDVFFEPGAPRSRRIFGRSHGRRGAGEGRITGFVDRREGRDIVWTREGR